MSDAALSFLGATGTVTGSRYLIQASGRRILIDCGLFQGYKQLRLRNWSPFPVEPSSIDAVLRFYGDKTGAWLGELTHRELPWLEARAGLAPGQRSDREITKEALAEYYGGLIATTTTA